MFRMMTINARSLFFIRAQYQRNLKVGDDDNYLRKDLNKFLKENKKRMYLFHKKFEILLELDSIHSPFISARCNLLQDLRLNQCFKCFKKSRLLLSRQLLR